MINRFIVSFLLMIFTQNSIAAINPPYITSASSVTAFSIVLDWRNNSFDTKGFIILRSSSTTNKFEIIDSVPATTLSFTDKPLQASTNYCYRLFAYNDTAISDSSNMVCATTLAKDTLLTLPIPLLHLDTIHSIVKISIINLSPGANGYRLFRKGSLSDSAILIHTFTNISPLDSIITFTDSGVLVNNRYYYVVEVYNNTKVLNNSGNIYVYVPYVPTTKDLIHFTLLGRIPLSSFTGWARMINDTILIKENSGLNKLSIIGTTDPSSPRYLGPASDTLLARYNTQYGILDTAGAYYDVIYRAFPFLFWYQDGPGFLHMGVYNKDHYDEIDSLSGSFAITSNFIIHNRAIFISKYNQYSYTALTGKYNRFSHDSLPNTPDNWIIGDSNFILANERQTYISKWNVYTISQNGKNMVFRYSTLWPYQRLYAEAYPRDVSNRIFFYFPYLFQVSNKLDMPTYTRILEVADVRQADTCTILGQLELVNANQETANLILFDTSRNMLIVFYPSEMDIFSIDKNIKAHMGVAPKEMSIRQNYAQYKKIVAIRFKVRANRIHLALPNIYLPCTISLYTVSGRLITTSKNISVNTIDLPIGQMPLGIYILSIDSPEMKYSEKLIIK